MHLEARAMSEKIPVLTFFNNKGGVGKTSLVYHTARMMEDMGLSVLACDLDPQANLTASFLDEEELEGLWGEDSAVPSTIHRCVRPLMKMGDVQKPRLRDKPILRRVSRGALWDGELRLVPGDLELSRFEQHLSEEWPRALDKRMAFRAMRIMSAFWQVAQWGGEEMNADVILADVGPNLGAINRAALIASDFFVTPLGADVYSLQGLSNLGPTVKEWREDWKKRLNENPREIDFAAPKGEMRPIGYVVNQPGAVRWNRPVMAYEKWMARIPNYYRKFVLGEDANFPPDKDAKDDEHCLAMAKHYRSLVPMAQEARKPIFHLTAADGAVGSHFTAALNARADFKVLTEKILRRMKVRIPDDPDT